MAAAASLSSTTALASQGGGHAHSGKNYENSFIVETLSTNDAAMLSSMDDSAYILFLKTRLQLSPAAHASIIKYIDTTRPHLKAKILEGQNVPALNNQNHVDISSNESDMTSEEKGSDVLEEEETVDSNEVDEVHTVEQESSFNPIFFGTGAALVAGVGAAISVGGGGGSSDDGKDNDPGEPPAPQPAPPEGGDQEPYDPGPPPEYSKNPDDYLTDEYNRNAKSMSAIKANEAYAREYAGYDTVIAVVDDGIDVNHPEFKDRIYAPYSARYNEYHGEHSGFHGTHVGGIAGAAKDGEGMHGVAWAAQLMPINYATRGGSLSSGPNGLYVGRAWEHAANNGATVVVNSWQISDMDYGTFTREDVESRFGRMVRGIDALVENEVISVFSAGNDEGDDPVSPASFPSVFPELKGYWMAVTSVDENNELSSWANKCGQAAEWCLAAPGENIYSTVPVEDGSYETYSGTSMAAPHVAGAVSVLKSAFPHLTSQEITSILFESADDIGPEEIYGHGLLNLEKATRPLGEVSVALSGNINGKRDLLSSSSLNLSPAFGDGVSLALEDKFVMALDEYNRGYDYSLSGLAMSNHETTPRDALRQLTSFMRMDDRHTHNVSSGPFYMMSLNRMDQEDLSVGRSGYSRMTFGFSGQGYSLEASLNPDMGKSFGLREDSLSKSVLANPQAFDQPHLSLMDTGYGSRMTFGLSQKNDLSIAAFSGNIENERANLFSNPPSLYGGVAELSTYLHESAVLKASVGGMSEEGSFLGSLPQGAFGENLKTDTLFANLAASFDVGHGVDLNFMGTVGQTSFKQSSGLLKSGENLITSSFALGFSKEGIFSNEDNLSFAIGQPLRVEGGRIKLSVPVARTMDGSIRHQSMSLSPESSGREIALQTGYSFDVMDGIDLSLGAMHRINANHVKGNNETIGLVGFNLSF